MERYCRGEASSRFGVRPQRIETLAPGRTGRGVSIVPGQFEARGGLRRFDCRFGPNGRFGRIIDYGIVVAGRPGRPPAPPAQPPREPDTNTERVRFEPGTTGTELTRRLAPGASTRFVIRARNGQTLYTRVAPRGPAISYQIFNPDRSFLLEQISSGREYRGQLWQTGDHVIEVINRTPRPADYNIIIGLAQ
jgi:hypothetical protein